MELDDLVLLAIVCQYSIEDVLNMNYELCKSMVELIRKYFNG